MTMFPSRLVCLLLCLFANAAHAAGPVNSRNLCSKTPETRFELIDIAITDAAAKGDIQTLGKALNAGTSPNGTTYDGFSLLHMAVTSQQDEVIKLLIKTGVDVNRPFMGTSPLALVDQASGAGSGGERRKQLLKNAGARLSDFDIAFEEVRELRRKGMARPILQEAIATGNKALFELFARSTYDINAPVADGIPPLHVAAFEGSLDMVRYLVSCGADVNARTSKGAPALWFARQYPDITAFLESKGAVE